jgi:hypothetical protein
MREKLNFPEPRIDGLYMVCECGHRYTTFDGYQLHYKKKHKAPHSKAL